MSTPKSPGQRSKVSLQNFSIKQLLGKGAFGEVYLVSHKGTDRLMALKQMDKKMIEMQGKQEHVKNEKRVLIKGKSDFLVKMHFSFQTKECLYLAMEYCPGGDLREFLEAIGSIEVEESVLWFSEMLMAVHTLHTLGYIHRDLKPDNFLIDARGHLKLADFGLSKVTKAKATHAQVGGVGSSAAALTARQQRLSLLPGQGNQQNMKEKLSKKNINRRFRRTMQLSVSGDGTRPPTHRPRPTHGMGGFGGLGEISEDGKGGSGGGGAAGGPNPLFAPAGSNLRGGAVPPTRKQKMAMRKQLAYSVVGSPDYMSPEVTSGLEEGGGIGYSEEVDWWSLGCVFFEVTLGVPPFTGDSPEEIFENIRNWRTIIPPLLAQYKQYMTPECFSLLSGFLCERHQRLGSDIKTLQAHPFFAPIEDWEALSEIESPFVPQGDD